MSTLFLCGKCGAKGGLHKEVDPITKIPEIHCVICGNIWWPGSQAGKRPNPIGGQWPEPIKKPEPVKPPETIQTTAMQESAHPLFEGVTVSKKGRSSWNIKGICSNCGRPNMQMARRHPNPLCGTCYYEVLHRDSGMTEEEALMRVKIRIHKKILQKEEAAIGLPKNKKPAATSKTKTRSNRSKITVCKTLSPFVFQITLGDGDSWIISAFREYCKAQPQSAKGQFVSAMESFLAEYKPNTITT